MKVGNIIFGEGGCNNNNLLLLLFLDSRLNFNNGYYERFLCSISNVRLVMRCKSTKHFSFFRVFHQAIWTVNGGSISWYLPYLTAKIPYLILKPSITHASSTRRATFLFLT